MQAVAFLHSQHICHLALTPAAIAVSNTTPPRYTLTNFAAAVQLDPLAKKTQLVSGQGVDPAYAAPEIAASETGRYNPVLGDRYSLGRTLQKLAQVSGRCFRVLPAFDVEADFSCLGGPRRMRRSSRPGWTRWWRS